MEFSKRPFIQSLKFTSDISNYVLFIVIVLIVRWLKELLLLSFPYLLDLLDLLEHCIRIDRDRLRHVERLVDSYQLVCELEHVVAERDDDELTVASHA